MTTLYQNRRDVILDILEEKGEVSFNKLEKATGLSSRTFERYIKRLLKEKTIAKDPYKIQYGKVPKHVNYFLIDRTKKLRYEARIKSKRLTILKKNWHPYPYKDSDKANSLLALLLYKAVFGSRRLKSDSPDKPGGPLIPRYRSLLKHPFNQRHPPPNTVYDKFQPYSIAGVSEEDLISTGNSDMMGAFSYIDFTPEEVRRCFDKLLRYDPAPIKPLPPDDKEKVKRHKEQRFIIANSLLKEFFDDLYVGVFTGIQNEMELTWTYIEWPYPRSGEAGWYMSLYGPKRTFYFAKKALRGKMIRRGKI
jgi:DNA-binding Lrp family transcriptional regulator